MSATYLPSMRQVPTDGNQAPAHQNRIWVSIGHIHLPVSHVRRGRPATGPSPREVKDREVSRMKACIRGAAVVVTAISTAVALTACGHDAGSGSGGGNNLTIGVLLPDAAT